MIKIAIDCMGGDEGLTVTVPGTVKVANRYPDTRFLLVGLVDQIEAALDKAKPNDRSQFEIVSATEVVTMDDPVEVALRRKKDSSMRVAITCVKDGRADACVSSGNTGALMALSRFVLKMLPGIDRPAIATALPNVKGGGTTVLDLGANVDCSAEHLLEFGIMGSALVQAIDHVEAPSVGILNIGQEDIKGNEQVKQAAQLLKNSHLNFYGNVEGDDIFKGTTDVIVCDGFVGNAVLKAIEGTASMILSQIKGEFKRNLFSKLAALLSIPVFGRLRKRLDNRRYNGAALLGLRGVVFKSHGSADILAFACAVERARGAVESNLLSKIIHSVEQSNALKSADTLESEQQTSAKPVEAGTDSTESRL